MYFVLCLICNFLFLCVLCVPAYLHTRLLLGCSGLAGPSCCILYCVTYVTCFILVSIAFIHSCYVLNLSLVAGLDPTRLGSARLVHSAELSGRVSKYQDFSAMELTSFTCLFSRGLELSSGSIIFLFRPNLFPAGQHRVTVVGGRPSLCVPAYSASTRLLLGSAYSAYLRTCIPANLVFTRLLLGCSGLAGPSCCPTGIQICSLLWITTSLTRVLLVSISDISF
jgi:hypothetical protein